jgi:hypothetical protein
LNWRLALKDKSQQRLLAASSNKAQAIVIIMLDSSQHTAHACSWQAEWSAAGSTAENPMDTHSLKQSSCLLSIN